MCALYTIKQDSNLRLLILLSQLSRDSYTSVLFAYQSTFDLCTLLVGPSSANPEGTARSCTLHYVFLFIIEEHVNSYRIQSKDILSLERRLLFRHVPKINAYL